MDLRRVVAPDDKKRVSIPPSHAGCMVCGEKDSLQLRFTAENHDVMARFQANSTWQGYQGALHGGMISTLLDAGALTLTVVAVPEPARGLLMLCGCVMMIWRRRR